MLTIPSDQVSAFLVSFALIGLAEVGDKSQLVCMALASRHRPWPVLCGAAAAFLVLNTLAVVLGAGVAAWIPERWVAGIVSLTFAAFGVNALLAQVDEEAGDMSTSRGQGIFLTTLSLIFLAEFGDKTQLAVAGLASDMPIVAVWLGATVALLTLSALGVWVGRTWLQRLPTLWLHRLGGAIFLMFAGIAAWRALS